MSLFRVLVFLFASSLLFGLTQPAVAQWSVYGGPVLSAYGFASDGETSFKSDSGGLLGGAFYNFPIHSRLTAGIDGRASYSFGPRGGTFVLGALRFGFVPQRVPLRPYLQLGGGAVRTATDLGVSGGSLATQHTTARRSSPSVSTSD